MLISHVVLFFLYGLQGINNDNLKNAVKIDSFSCYHVPDSDTFLTSNCLHEFLVFNVYNNQAYCSAKSTRQAEMYLPLKTCVNVTGGTLPGLNFPPEGLYSFECDSSNTEITSKSCDKAEKGAMVAGLKMYTIPGGSWGSCENTTDETGMKSSSMVNCVNGYLETMSYIDDICGKAEIGTKSVKDEAMCTGIFG